MEIFIYLSGGLFLGWSLGANDAANIFGTAVGSKMIRFRTAALIAGAFVILGAGFSGAGAAHTLSKLGSVNKITGSFTVTVAAALSVYWMTKLHLPVSTSQAIVGAIIGWNLFSGSLTDYNSLIKIVSTWIISPVIAALFSIIIHLISRKIINGMKIHLLKLDFYNRLGFIIVGAFGSYALGANNIANVMGVFVSVSPFKPLELSSIRLTGSDQLFILGGIAIAAGIFTYSYRVMITVGNDIVKLSPVTALNAVFSSSIVMFLFASERLESLLSNYGLPAIPLVPVSSSQVIVGAVIGIGLLQGGRGINYKIIARIGSGWVTTPAIACLISFVSLFFLQNVFNLQVYNPREYRISEEALNKIKSENIDAKVLETIKDKNFENARSFKKSLKLVFDEYAVPIKDENLHKIIEISELYYLRISYEKIEREAINGWFSEEQQNVIKLFEGKEFNYRWQLYNILSGQSDEWKYKPDIIENRDYNRKLRARYEYLFRVFHIDKKISKYPR